MDDRSKEGLLREVDRYLLAGRALFPLRPGRKEPLQAGWQTINYTRQMLHGFVRRRGCNIGWRLGARDLVIDIDPRHPRAAGSEELLTEKWGVANLGDICPTVHTGGKDRGRHYYTKIKDTVKLKTQLSKYPDIDFRRHGHYVLIAGCIHPDTGRRYNWDLFAPTEVSTIPDWLFKALRVDDPSNPPPRKQKDHVNPSDSPNMPAKTMSIHEIEGHLFAIPTTKYQNYHDWLRIGMAVHYASAGSGEGEELWVKWSTSDPAYYDAEEVARAKWKSFSDDKDEEVTAATLVAAAMLEGGSPNGLPASIAFDTRVTSAPSLTSLDDFMRLLTTKDKPPLAKAVAQACTYGEDNWDDLRDIIKHTHNARLVTIDKIKTEHCKTERVKATKRRKGKHRGKDGIRSMADPAINIANHVLETRLKETSSEIIHAKNQEFYEYTGTHWEQIPPNEVEQLIFNSAEAIQLNPGNLLKFKSSAMFNSVENVLIAKTAQRKDVFQFAKPPRPVVNTRNCEVWISPDGTHEARPHRPESYLLSCLDTDYDPDALCPRFDQALVQLFRDNKEPDEMTRHLFEFYGYVMQPAKNIPTWWMLQGEGGNGKTFCLNIYTKLLGSAVLPWPIEKFADNGQNNHATASLVGKLLVLDDDARVDAFLPESGLKKLSESKLFEANPKRQTPFTFLSCATPVMLINDWPRIRDLSWGLIRKSYILPFRRVLDPKEYDLGLEPHVVAHELPGVLNKALEGYHRLRLRGNFDEPAECIEARQQWMRAANALVEFTSTELHQTGNGVYLPLSDVYQHYMVWCRNVGGVRQPAAKHRFEITLKQLGFGIGTKDGVEAVLSTQMKGSAPDVFTEEN